MPKPDSLTQKIVVSHRGALRGKYGSAGFARIEAALEGLVRADGRRGFKTRVIWLDGAALGGERVRDPGDPVAFKGAVDAIAVRYRPEYLMLLGSHDVVPYQDLDNPLYAAGDPESDPDRFVPSDLPYACEGAYSQRITDFLGPTRVVGRLPDLTGATRPTYLLRLLKQAAAAKPGPVPGDVFALSAKVWVGSTKTSIRRLLGTAPKVLTAPRAGPAFTQAELGRAAHFINCHGNLSDWTFSGEGPKERYSTALDASSLTGISKGAVAAFECCYGAELFDPAGLPSMGVAQRYLEQGAQGLVASTTIAYGPEDGNGQADVICQVFLEQLLRGASLGRALLESRLGYVRQQSVADPYDQKTLAQFVLLGDPSLHPFASAPAPKAGGAREAVQAARQQRRVRLMKAGAQIGSECAYCELVVQSKAAGKAAGKRAAKSAAKAQGLPKGLGAGFDHLIEFRVHEQMPLLEALGRAGAGKGAAKTAGKASTKQTASAASMPQARRVFVSTRRRAGDSEATPRLEGLLAYEVAGRLVELHVFSR